MTKPTGLDKVSRRRFMGRAVGMTAAAMIAGPAFAQSAIEDIITSPGRGVWDDQFDAQSSRSVAQTTTRHPIASADTIGFVERAIFDYQSLISRGGWPFVPATKKLRMGVSEPEVRILRQRLIASGDLDPNAGLSNEFDSYVDGAVKKFQARHGLPPDGVLGSYSYQALNVSADIRLGQLETNLVRLRSMSGFLGDRYVMVNIPAAQIEAVENGSVVLRHTAIVGKIDRQTPILNSKIHEIILNPYWTSPRSIIEKDIVPLMRKDPTYLARNNIRLFDNQGNEVAPETLDWHAEKAPELMFRQDPGKGNAMSSTKINFHNPHAVYMHDTPQQGVFNQLMRFESSGCVRVQNVRDLNTWLLRDTPGWNRQTMEATIASGENTVIALTEPVPVYFTYFTAWASGDGVVQFRDDVYQRDGVDELALR
ncbi:MAG: L,D-transpeptidase family protein [Hoeflea sp.]|uniref:L,D-transpeptidase family protein n=1 Tax=Hoeflea sp. TaxID=1940281 RepID=UPI001D209E7B|nr:L,D-transpeptidase family protein [Hoeflea sp.]MBU4530045.1 L,D-transpeptidase family protein [Alphaproteobacteria bacterium]MBU4542670.1 L,D-transpeptidase family protein [Alphaproteobacteria bacterium]MBU4551351.1 L,D-transpeptidase family protein [Alphaproteobacteria bacterium]MBV1723174.1 L,D-transpeptidase family protein [Hoeflea sp.]MBV1760185.1 L,D-transpeptidase family protein [Hoeflea sp.]